MGLFDDIGGFISSVADDIGGGIGDIGNISDPAGLAGDLFGGSIGSFFGGGGGGSGLFDFVSDVIPGDIATTVADIGGAIGSSGGMGGLFGTVTGALDNLGVDLPDDIRGLADELLGADFGGVFDDPAGFVTEQLGLGNVLGGAGVETTLGWASEATGLDLDGVMTLGGSITDSFLGGSGWGEHGFGDIAGMGLGALDDLVPGAGDVVGSFLGGADPGSILTAVGGVAGVDLGGLGRALDGGGFDLSALGGLGESLGIELPDSVDAFVSQLGAGDTGALISQLGDGIGGFVDSLGSDAASNLVNQFVNDGTLGNLLESADGGAIQGLLGKVADAGDLESVLGQLDPGQTADLVGKLLAGGAAASGPMGAVASGLRAGANAAGAAASGADADDLLGASDVLGADAMAAAGVDAMAAAGTDPLAGDGGGLDLDLVAADPLGGGASDPATVAAGADDPLAGAGAFDDGSADTSRFAAAEQVEDSVEDLFDGLGSPDSA